MKLTSVLKTLATVCAVALTQIGSQAQAKETIPGVAEQPATYFYTGKPYDNDLGNYTFAYRNYNPEINRWTSANPSGFPDGANVYSYVNSAVNNHIDSDGLESQTLTMSFGFPVFSSKATGKWEGSFVWSFAHGEERANTRINETPGFSGFTGIPLTVTIGGVDFGVGFAPKAIATDKSTFNTRTLNGIQEKQWEVDLEVKLVYNVTVGVTVYSETWGTFTKSAKGDWYE